MKEEGKKFLTYAFRGLSSTLGFNKPQFVFVMGHMRSGSTLLSHLLLSNPHVLGLGESNAIYQSQDDLWRLVMKSQWKYKRFSKKVLYLDQINHNSKTPHQELLEQKTLKLIILYREPKSALSSLMELTKKHYPGKWTLEKADRYLKSRYDFLRVQLERLPQNQVFLLQYESLISTPNEVLEKLTNFLQLDSPLTTTYQSFSFTGKHGDPSAKIHSGEILPRKASHNYSIAVSDACIVAFKKLAMYR